MIRDIFMLEFRGIIYTFNLSVCSGYDCSYVWVVELMSNTLCLWKKLF